MQILYSYFRYNGSLFLGCARCSIIRASWETKKEGWVSEKIYTKIWVRDINFLTALRGRPGGVDLASYWKTTLTIWPNRKARGQKISIFKLFSELWKICKFNLGFSKIPVSHLFYELGKTWKYTQPQTNSSKFKCWIYGWAEKTYVLI